MMNKNEKPQERFKRLATSRTNAVLTRIKILGNCSNRQIYDYTEADVDAIFSVIDRKIKEIKSKFFFPKEEKFKL